MTFSEADLANAFSIQDSVITENVDPDRLITLGMMLLSKVIMNPSPDDDFILAYALGIETNQVDQLPR